MEARIDTVVLDAIDGYEDPGVYLLHRTHESGVELKYQSFVIAIPEESKIRLIFAIPVSNMGTTRWLERFKWVTPCELLYVPKIINLAANRMKKEGMSYERIMKTHIIPADGGYRDEGDARFEFSRWPSVFEYKIESKIPGEEPCWKLLKEWYNSCEGNADLMTRFECMEFLRERGYQMSLKNIVFEAFKYDETFEMKDEYPLPASLRWEYENYPPTLYFTRRDK